MAVPIASLAEFVGKFNPCLAAALFPHPHDNVSVVSQDFYPKLVVAPETIRVHHRTEEPENVRVLRDKAQDLVDNIRNFVAVQTFAWGSGTKAPSATAAYEVRVLEGEQRFREFPNGKKLLAEEPFPPLNNSISTGPDWAWAPWMVARELGLRVIQAPDAIANGKQVRVFQYKAGIEDKVCFFRLNLDFGFFVVDRTKAYSCYGEVWTDADMNILRISQHLELSGTWKDWYSVVTYSWLRRPGEDARLVPLTISAQAIHNNRTYWCRGQFMNYRVFSSQVKMLQTSSHSR
jgi:hypothetical protein